MLENAIDRVNHLMLDFPGGSTITSWVLGAASSISKVNM